MTDSPSPDSQHAVRRFFGGALLAIGILWVALSGACTLLFVGGTLLSTLTNRGSFAEIASMLPLEVVIGAVCIAPGLALLFGGRALLKPLGRTR